MYAGQEANAVTDGGGWRNRIVGEGEMDPREIHMHPLNWRAHGEEQAGALDALLGEVGWVQRVIVNRRTGNLVDGHLRVELALRREEPVVPVLYVDLDEAEEGLVLATLDPIGAMAAVNAVAYDQLLRQVEAESESLQALLAKQAEEAGLYQEPGEVPEAPEPQVDRAEELRAKWGTERGQVWQVGRHRLMCGDSTSEADVARLLDGGKPLLMVTDPPYGVEYDAGWRDEAAARGLIAHAARRVGKVQNDDRVDWADAFRLFPGDVFYTWSPPGDHLILTGLAVQAAGYDIRYQIIWAKPRFVISRGHYHWQHEVCWYAVKKGRQAHWCGDRSQTSLWEIALDKNVEGGHSTQKPVECMARPIRNHEGDVYDPFLGSGTTMVAAEQLGRVCYGMEIAPKYVAVTLERMAGMGLEPRLAETKSPADEGGAAGDA
jgi:DNA modification methylase